MKSVEYNGNRASGERETLRLWFVDPLRFREFAACRVLAVEFDARWFVFGRLLGGGCGSRGLALLRSCRDLSRGHPFVRPAPAASFVFFLWLLLFCRLLPFCRP